MLGRVANGLGEDGGEELAEERLDAPAKLGVGEAPAEEVRGAATHLAHLRGGDRLEEVNQPAGVDQLLEQAIQRHHVGEELQQAELGQRQGAEQHHRAHQQLRRVDVVEALAVLRHGLQHLDGAQLQLRVALELQQAEKRPEVSNALQLNFY